MKISFFFSPLHVNRADLFCTAQEARRNIPGVSKIYSMRCHISSMDGFLPGLIW